MTFSSEARFAPQASEQDSPRNPGPRCSSACLRHSIALAGTVLALVSCTGGHPAEAGSANTGTTGATGASNQTASNTPTSSASLGSTSSESTGEPQNLCDETCFGKWVHEGDLTITPDTDPASLLCMSGVKGTVWISGFAGPLPLELRGLKSVTGGLVILGNEGLASLHGLECVRSTSGLEISENPVLTDISALRLTSSRIISIRLNPQLESAIALSSVADVTSLSFLGNERLEVLPELLPSVQLRHLAIEACPALEGLDALSAARGMSNPVPPMTISLRDNKSLSSIVGIAGLWSEGSVPEVVTLEQLPSLKSLAGLDGLGEVTFLTISDLSILEDLSGLKGLEFASHIRLEDLPSLSSLDGLGALQEAELLRIGGCGEANSGLDGLLDLSGLGGVSALGVLALANNDALNSLAGMPLLTEGPFELYASDNSNLQLDEINTFVSQHNVLSVCASPPQVDCPCP